MKIAICDDNMQYVNTFEDYLDVLGSQKPECDVYFICDQSKPCVPNCGSGGYYAPLRYANPVSRTYRKALQEAFLDFKERKYLL